LKPPGKQSLEAISKVPLNYFEPKHFRIAERFYFHEYNQATTETIAQYNVALRKLAAV